LPAKKDSASTKNALLIDLMSGNAPSKRDGETSEFLATAPEVEICKFSSTLGASEFSGKTALNRRNSVHSEMAVEPLG
jgi:hypothetical protein